MPSVALATFAELPDRWAGDDLAVRGLLTRRGIEAELVAWDDRAVDWDRFDLVVIRSTWNYARHRDDFVAWARRLGARLRNAPELIAWNSDKTYLDELTEAGIATVPTSFVAPGDALPELDGEVAVKPNVSAGARDTGRFSPASHDAARRLVERIVASGRTALVQPYLRSVDKRGETAIVHLRGEESHVLRKRAVLRPDEVAPVAEDAVGAATVMYGDELVGPGTAESEERELARRVLGHIAERFGGPPLIARVDMVRDESGAPVLMELEAVEPNLYLHLADGLVERFAAAVAAELDPMPGA